MRTFDLLDTPLEGVNLIEASAGTGKTYTIEGLWLRMILERQLPVEQVLVVTFTKAAAEELRLRIRRKLQSALKACRGEEVTDGLVQTLIKRQAPGPREIQALQHALIDFDRAAIFTIHGFCQRLLFENAFETGSLFDTELVSDPSAFNGQIVDDFWRQHFYDAPPELIAFAISKGISGPEAFAELLPWSQVPALRVIPDPGQPSMECLAPYRASLDRLRASWSSSRADAIAFLNDPGLSGTVYGSLKPVRADGYSSPRELKVRGLVETMDRFLDPRRSGFPLFVDFDKFTAVKIDRARRRGHVRPLSPVFALCQDVFERAQTLEAECEGFLVHLKASVLHFARSTLKQLKLQRNVQFFDDLLLRVNRALDSPSGKPLADTVRRRHQVALVDEFQDTDPVQYAIFKRLFGTPPSLLFMIGDPKQAIYSFRGADIFAYLRAARDADLKYTLRENWRSSPGLIQAVNTLFTNTPRPFVFDAIAFEGGRPGAPHAKTDDRWHPPLTLWFLPSEGARPMSKTEAVQRISRAVAEEIGRLLRAPSETTGRVLQSGEIAVLVRTNRQASLIKRCLADLQVPAVLHSAGSVFDSTEALEVERILESLVDPGDERRFRAALSTRLLGARAVDLDGEAETSMFLETRRENFRTYSQVWHRRGFIHMFRMMLAREGIRPRLLSLTNGERRLTNVLHLEELLQRESIESQLGPAGILKKLAELRQRSESRLEEHQLRLESDAEAVKIVTTHKSKGLQYPVVFVPFGWEGSLIRSPEVLFHDSRSDARLTLDLAAGATDASRRRAQRELLAENLRLLYVALTRAQSKCYLVWGRFNTAQTSAMAYLLHFKSTGADEENLLEALQGAYSAKGNQELISDLRQLEKRAAGSIRIVSLPTGGCTGAILRPPSEAHGLFSRKFSGHIQSVWKVSSFSTLISGQETEPELPDRDSEPIAHLPVDESTAASEGGATLDIHTFPKGPQAGNFFHDLLEQLDFGIDDPVSRASLITEKLAAYGFSAEWAACIERMLQKLLTTPLLPGPGGFILSAIPPEDRIHELEFYFPLKPVTPKSLGEIFTRCGGTQIPASFTDRIGSLLFAPAAGFMKGYVDMVFRHAGRYFLVDWKSNALGSDRNAYRSQRLAEAMTEGLYFLQYHLYVLALHQYLSRRKPDYDYARDFGGVFYLFLRGVDPRHGPDCGIYRDLPDPELIRALGRALIPGF